MSQLLADFSTTAYEQGHNSQATELWAKYKGLSRILLASWYNSSVDLFMRQLNRQESQVNMKANSGRAFEPANQWEPRKCRIRISFSVQIVKIDSITMNMANLKRLIIGHYNEFCYKISRHQILTRLSLDV